MEKVHSKSSPLQLLDLSDQLKLEGRAWNMLNISFFSFSESVSSFKLSEDQVALSRLRVHFFAIKIFLFLSLSMESPPSFSQYAELCFFSNFGLFQFLQKTTRVLRVAEESLIRLYLKCLYYNYRVMKAKAKKKKAFLSESQQQK
jgi:hypothetical protein